MDKDFILKILNNNQTSISDASVLISSYCEELDKPKDLIPKFISVIINTHLIQAAIENALEYYKKKYNITEIEDLKKNKTLLYY